MKHNVVMVAAAIVIAGLVIGGAFVMTRTITDVTASPPPGPAQKVDGRFTVYPNGWFKTIPGTTWKRCDHQGCTGSECYGRGPAEGLDQKTPVVVSNSEGIKVARGVVSKTWGWKTGASHGVCILAWAAVVPRSEHGLLTVTFNDDPDLALDFTLAKLRRLPHLLDLSGIGDTHS